MGVKCQKCGHEFEGNFCPNCGAPAQSGAMRPDWAQQATYQEPDKWYRRRRKKLSPIQIVGVVLGSVTLFFILIVMLLIASPVESSGGSSAVAAGVISSQQSSSSSRPDATKVDYKVLYKDYEDNPINADSKYRDKKLQLTGTIANIDRDIAQSPYITFNIDEYGAKSIKMAFDDDEVVAKLKKGQKVTVVGTCGGSFASTIVTLNDCSIVE